MPGIWPLIEQSRERWSLNPLNPATNASISELRNIVIVCPKYCMNIVSLFEEILSYNLCQYIMRSVMKTGLPMSVLGSFTVIKHKHVNNMLVKILKYILIDWLILQRYHQQHYQHGHQHCQHHHPTHLPAQPIQRVLHHVLLKVVPGLYCIGL